MIKPTIRFLDLSLLYLGAVLGLAIAFPFLLLSFALRFSINEHKTADRSALIWPYPYEKETRFVK